MKSGDRKQYLEEFFCNGAKLAELLCLSPRRIDQLAQDGTIPKAGKNRYNLIEVLKAYHAKINRQVRSPEQEALKMRLLAARASEREAKARQAKYQADKEEGKLLSLDDVSAQWAARYVELKAELSELPRRVAFRFTDPTVRLRVEEEISAFVHETLERYSREGIKPLNSN